MWVIATLASLAVLIILVLCVPLDMSFRMEADGRPKFRMRLLWFFGFFSKELGKRKKKPEEKRGVAEGKLKVRKRVIQATTILRILRTKGLLRQLKDLIIKGIFSHLKTRDLAADFKIGLGDPANTGLLFAFIGPATALFGSSHRHQIRVEPDFRDDAVLEGYSHGTARLHPIKLVPPFLKFIFSLTTIKIAKTLISSKWRGN